MIIMRYKLGRVAIALAVAALAYNVIGPFKLHSNQYNELIYQLNYAPIGKRIVINIDSGGGYLISGMPVYYAIKNSKATVQTKVKNKAGSMAQFILMVGDEVWVSHRAFIFFHSITSGKGVFKRRLTAETKRIMGPYFKFFTEKEQAKMITIKGLFVRGRDLCAKFTIRIITSAEHYCVFKGFK